MAINLTKTDLVNWARANNANPEQLTAANIIAARDAFKAEKNTDIELVQVINLQVEILEDAAGARRAKEAAKQTGSNVQAAAGAGQVNSKQLGAMGAILAKKNTPIAGYNVFANTAVPGSKQARPTAQSLGLDKDLNLTPAEKAQWKASFDALPAAGGPTLNQELPDNVEAWNASWWIMQQAMTPTAGQPHTYDFTNFIVQPDIVGMARLGAMYKMARGGTKVRAVLDATGTKAIDAPMIGKDYLQEIVNTGNAEIRSYNPKSKSLWGQFKDKFKDNDGLNIVSCSHKKYEILDGRNDQNVEGKDDENRREIVKGGGRNTAVYYYTRGDKTYNDHETLSEGKGAAKAATISFEEDFNDTKITSDIRPDKDNIVSRETELAGAYFLMDSWLKGEPPLTDAQKAKLKSDPEACKELAKKMIEGMDERLVNEKFGDKPVGHKSNWRDRSMPNSLSVMHMGVNSLNKQARELASLVDLHGSQASYTPPNESNCIAAETKVVGHSSSVGTTQRGIDVETGDHKDPLVESLVRLSKSAKKRILITNPYVVLTKTAQAALKEAAERGVQIDILTNSPQSTDSILTQAFFVEAWPKALATIPGLRLFTTTRGRNADGTDDEDGMTRKLHSKFAVFDDQIVVDGSFNLDVISAQMNSEGVQIVRSEEMAKQVTKTFAKQIEDLDNGVVEYQIARDPNDPTKALLDEKGNPIELFGPRNHMSQKELDDFNKIVKQLVKIRKLKRVNGFFWNPNDVNLLSEE